LWLNFFFNFSLSTFYLLKFEFCSFFRFGASNQMVHVTSSHYFFYLFSFSISLLNVDFFLKKKQPSWFSSFSFLYGYFNHCFCVNDFFLVSSFNIWFVDNGRNDFFIFGVSDQGLISIFFNFFFHLIIQHWCFKQK
jgi:hypothetical protein